MKISVSIVIYNSENEIDDVLLSLKNSDCYDDLLVFVVDNQSTDGAVEHIRNDYSRIDILESSINLGYGRGHNQVIKNVDSDIHFIINPDIKFDSNTISKCIAFMEENKDIALMIPQVRNYVGERDVVPRRLPTIRRLIGSFLNWKKGKVQEWRKEYYMADASYSEPFEVDICSGCFMVARTSFLKQVNGFDERYFLYFEDFDLSRKMGELGRIVCNPLIEVFHEGQRDGHKSVKSFGRLINSMIKYFCKWGWKL